MEKITQTKINLRQGRYELHDVLGLSSCEISINELAPGASIPFVHSHKDNEEIYIILAGKGFLYVDGEIIIIQRDDCIKIDLDVHRSLKASIDGLRYICVQAKANSLSQFTKTDGVLHEDEQAFTE